MGKTAIVTDSTADIPRELLNGLNISIVPLQVIWGDETYLDGVDISAADFYTRMENSTVLPTTSQPTPAAFKEVYGRLLDDGYDILSAHISAGLSATCDSARLAKKDFPKARIEIIDSTLTSIALGFPILETARRAREGATLDECTAFFEQAIKLSGAIFIPKTLEYLHRGGRIGGAAAFFGSALDLKPILALEGGKIVPIERIRTMNKAIDRMMVILKERIGNKTPIHVSSMTTNLPEQADLLLDKVRQNFDVTNLKEAFTTVVSPVLGAHAGPGTIAIGYMAGI